MLNPLLTLPHYSFPSGHALGSMAFYGLLAYLVIQRVPIWRWRVAASMIAGVLILLTGFSRMYLGANYFSLYDDISVSIIAFLTSAGTTPK